LGLYMNKPKTATPKRWTFPTSPAVNGTFYHGLSNEEYLILLGTIASTWSRIEDSMIHIFSDILNIDFHSGVAVRQVYFSIVNARTRIDIMKNALERNPRNISKDREYDDILDKFGALSKRRNDYIHGLWMTHESGDVYVVIDSKEEYFLNGARKIGAEELKECIKNMNELQSKIIELINKIINSKLEISMPTNVSSS